jgi:hypothetical protein
MHAAYASAEIGDPVGESIKMEGHATSYVVTPFGGDEQTHSDTDYRTNKSSKNSPGEACTLL